MDKVRYRDLGCGDIIAINFSPSKGHEQKGYRPGIVLSDPATQIELGGLTTVAPITNNPREFFTRVPLDEHGMQTTGSILMDQVKVLDLSAREFVYLETAPDEVLSACKEIFEAIYEKLLSC